MAKVLVTGADGFIGKYVCTELTKKGYEVIPFDIKRNPALDLGTCLEPLDSLLDEAKYVIHLAAMPGLDQCYKDPLGAVQANITNTVRLFEMAKNKFNLDKIIIASTWAVGGNKLNPYDITKSCVEDFANSYQVVHQMPIVVFRLGTTYGVGMNDKGVIPSFIKRAKAGEPLVIRGSKDIARQYTHVSDIASAFVKGLKYAIPGEIYTIVDDKVTTLEDLARYFSNEIVYEAARATDENYEPLSNRKTMLELNWRPRMKLSDGIKDMIEHG